MRPSRRLNIERLVEKQINLWNAELRDRKAAADEAALRARSVEECIAPYVAVSRQVGSLGNELATALAEQLGTKLYDREIVDFIADKASVRVAAVKSLGETWYNRTHDWIAGTIDRRFLACDDYVRHLLEVITALASHGPSVFLGRGVGFFMPTSRGLRVRVVAPIEQRIEYAVSEWEMSETDARALIARSDSSKEAFVRTYFKASLTDPLSHDLCLNMGTTPLDDAVAICLEAHKRKLGDLG